MAAKLDIELGDKVTGPAAKIASSLDALVDKAEKLEAKAASAAKASADAAEKAATKAQTSARKPSASPELPAPEQGRFKTPLPEGVSWKEQTKEEAKAAAKAERDRASAAKAAAREVEKAKRLEVRVAEKAARDVERAADRAAKAEAREAKKIADAKVREAKRAAKAEENAKLKIAAKGSFVGNLAADAVQSVLSLARTAVMATHDFVKLGEAQRFAFESMGGEFPASASLAHADALAERFGLTVEETRKQYRDLMDLELDTTSIDTFVRLGADMKATGEEAQSVAAMMNALAKIKVKGVLDTRGLMALGAAGVQRTHLLAGLAKELGAASADEDDLAKALGKKGMSANKAIEIVQKAIMAGVGESAPGEIAAKFADKTLTGVEGKIKAKATGIALEVASNLEAPMAQILNEVNAKLQDVDVKGLTSDIKDMSESLKTLASVVGAVGKAFGWLGGEAAATVGDLDFKIGNRIENIAAISNSQQSLPGKIGGAITETALGAFDLVRWAAGFRDVGSTATDELVASMGGKLKPEAVALGANMSDGLAEGIRVSGVNAENVAREVAANAAAAMRDELDVHSPSRVTGKIGIFTGQGLARGIRISAGEVSTEAREVARLAAEGMTPEPVTLQGPTFAPADTQPQLAGGIDTMTATAAPASTLAAVTRGGEGRVTVTIPITVQGVSDPEEAARLTSQMLRVEVENLFAELAEQV